MTSRRRPTDRRHAFQPRLALLAAAAFLACVAGAGCVDSTATSTRSGACAGELTATVSAGTTPTFTWSPACKITRLLVLKEDGGAEAWLVEAGENAIASGVKYGVVPAGATQGAPPTALVAGQVYDLVLLRTTAAGSLEVAGGTAFTP